MEEEIICDVCTKTLSNVDDLINCKGLCNKKFHSKCVKLTPTVAKHMRECKNLQFNCNECSKNPGASLNSTIMTMMSFLHIIDERVKRHDQKFSGIDDQLKDISELIKKNCEEIKAEVKTIEGDRSMKVKDNLQPKASSSTVVVQPKKSQRNETTKSELLKNIDPKSIKINNVQAIPKGGIAINCKTDDETNKLRDEVTRKMGDTYTVRVSESKSVKVKIIGIGENLDDDVLIQTIKSQNEYMEKSNIKVLTKFDCKKNNGYGAIIEIENECYNQIMRGEKLKIGWCVCKVFECIDVRRCFKCCGYNHKSSVCKNRIACLKCGGEHIMKDCKAKNCVCINCKVAVDKLNIKIDIFHPAYSLNCPIYKRKIENEKKRREFRS